MASAHLMLVVLFDPMQIFIVALSLTRNNYPPSISFTTWLIRDAAARPESCLVKIPMTLPISFIEEAPVSAMAAWIAWRKGNARRIIIAREW